MIYCFCLSLMSPFAIAATILFILGYLLISLEKRFNTHKSAVSLALGATLWVITAFSGTAQDFFRLSIEKSGSDIFAIIIFLLSAMTLVEILVHYKFFDFIRLKLSKLNLDNKGQFLMISTMSFFLSAVLDNLTCTVVMTQIARRFFRDKNLLLATAGIVIAANAGGSWSPIGDVTTLMLWLANKFAAHEIITGAFLPAVSLTIVATFLLKGKMDKDILDTFDKKLPRPTRGEKLVISICLASFALPLLADMIGLPPYMGLLFGLGLVWLVIEFVKSRTNHVTHLEANIDAILQKTDISAIEFFVGILLSVSALRTLGALETISQKLFGYSQEFWRVTAGNILIGLTSAIFDNVSLTALSINVIRLNDPSIWVLLALAVGTGGSILIIGSAAGVVAMGMVKDLTFEKYLKLAFWPAFLGYCTAILVWFLQYQLEKLLALS